MSPASIYVGVKLDISNSILDSAEPVWYSYISMFEFQMVEGHVHDVTMCIVSSIQLMISEIRFYTTDKMGKRIIQPSAVTILLICYIYLCYIESAATMESTHFLKPEDVFENDKPGLQIFCHNANSKYVMHMWRSLTMHLNTNIDNYDIYNGKSSQEVMAKHDDNQKSWNFYLFGTKRHKKFKMNPFKDTCIGIYVYPSKLHKYSVNITQTRIDIFNLSLMLLGSMIYWNAHKLSRNPLFYYLCGITFGVTTSIVILVYFVSKLLPRGKIMYLMVVTGWTMSFYLIQALWENAQLIAVQYREWVTWYILLASLISFVICYRFGPVTNPRTKKLIEWSLQIGGLIMMYYSSYFHEASFFCCILIVLLYNFPIVLIRRSRSYCCGNNGCSVNDNNSNSTIDSCNNNNTISGLSTKEACMLHVYPYTIRKAMFPDKRKLLTEDEYRIEGIKETHKALNELKGYCTSPECNPWKTVLRLKDPIRFARFMEGESHLSDDESREYDAEITRIMDECEYSDEEDDLL